MSQDRPKQELPAEIIDDLLGAIRRQFCAELDTKTWCQSRRFFMRVVTYPAGWLNGRGVTLPPERYKAILLDIFNEVKAHGTTGAVKYWPGYLLHVVQEHFRHQGETYYDEGKSLRAQLERSMLAFSRVPKASQAPDPVADLARAHAVLSNRKPRPAARRETPAQQGLLGL